ncbi:MAG: sulfotransferase [Solirubrobacteraceae bacterium]
MASPSATAPSAAPTLAPAPSDEFHALVEQRLQWPVEVREPLVLISQIQRSGGTLLSQLLDAHPQLHAHPHELHIGYPRDKRDWPRLDLSEGSEQWFRSLREAHVDRLLVAGYRKYARKWVQYEDERLETYPFLLVPSLQRRLFERCARSWTIERQRDVLDAYMTAYFNAWIDNRNLYAGPKRWITGFSARLAIDRVNRERFFADYPDGRLVAIIREPRSWYGSALAYNADRYGNPEISLRLWAASAEAMIDAKRQFTDSVFLIAFEEMLRDTEGTMRSLAEFLGIDFTDTLITPTFNGLPIKANSSFRVERGGVLDAPLRRHEGLPAEALETIERLTDGLYDRVLALTG